MIITEEHLLNPIGKSAIGEFVAQIVQSNGNLAALIDLTFHKNEQVGFRAAWILENILSAHPDQFTSSTLTFLDRFALQQNQSARRHFAKILAYLTHKKAPITIKKIIDNYDTHSLVATVFNWLIDEKVPVAVKSQCLNVLANLHLKHNWIKDELIATMDYLVDKESIAFFAKVKQIRKQLR